MYLIEHLFCELCFLAIFLFKVLLISLKQAYQSRSIEYGPVYKEQLGPVQMVVISDPAEYSKVIRSEGKYPNRREMEPMAFYRKQKGLDLGLVNS